MITLAVGHHAHQYLSHAQVVLLVKFLAVAAVVLAVRFAVLRLAARARTARKPQARSSSYPYGRRR